MSVTTDFQNRSPMHTCVGRTLLTLLCGLVCHDRQLKHTQQNHSKQVVRIFSKTRLLCTFLSSFGKAAGVRAPAVRLTNGLFHDLLLCAGDIKLLCVIVKAKWPRLPSALLEASSVFTEHVCQYAIYVYPRSIETKKYCYYSSRPSVQLLLWNIHVLGFVETRKCPVPLNGEQSVSDLRTYFM